MSAGVEHLTAPSDHGSVLLDIGGDVGALIVHTSEDMCGRQIDITSLGGGQGTHAVVRTRRLGGSLVHAAVFPQLLAGDYLLHGIKALPARPVTVSGGTITELVLPGRPRTGD